MVDKPKVSSEGAKELEKVAKQFDKFDADVKSMTLDRMNQAPKVETEEQTKLSQNQINRTTDVYLKPKRTLGSREKFNEDYRTEYNFAKEYVQFIGEHKECIGDSIEIWTKPFAGCPAEEWLVPTNTPVWGPRYLAEQIKRKCHHRLIMKDVTTGGNGNMQFYGQMAADTTIQRLDARPVSSKKSVFMTANNF